MNESTEQPITPEQPEVKQPTSVMKRDWNPVKQFAKELAVQLALSIAIGVVAGFVADKILDVVLPEDEEEEPIVIEGIVADINPETE